MHRTIRELLEPQPPRYYLHPLKRQHAMSNPHENFNIPNPEIGMDSSLLLTLFYYYRSDLLRPSE